MLALLGDRLPVGPDWSYEVKWDGYRALLIKHGASVQLRSRRDADLTASYPSLVAAGRSLRAPEAILDGEVVALTTPTAIRPSRPCNTAARQAPLSSRITRSTSCR
jgi:ATP-dependent DNA ligase